MAIISSFCHQFVGVRVFELFEGALDINALNTKYYDLVKGLNCGAWLSFCGIVRAEDGVEALFFEMDETLLQTWFKAWQIKVLNENVKLFFAHSKGLVKASQSSYLAGVLSKQRKLGLRLLNDFVEDFKANAPIWKYDVIKGEKIYAKERSTKLFGAGLLS